MKVVRGRVLFQKLRHTEFLHLFSYLKAHKDEKILVIADGAAFAIQLQVCLVALERVDVNNIVLHAPEQYHVACGKVSPVADLKQRKQKADSVVERRRKATLPAV